MEKIIDLQMDMKFGVLDGRGDWIWMSRTACSCSHILESWSYIMTCIFEVCSVTLGLLFDVHHKVLK
jgi:hypothetical protein